MNTILRLQDVKFAWSRRSTFALAVRELELTRGETVLLLGESGSGKSTLLSLICGILSPDEGQIFVDETNLASLTGASRDRFRAEKIGVIFQQFNLLPFATVADNILLPLRFAPKRRARAGDAPATAIDLCARLGLPRSIMSARASTLSVGQQQRVAVARALIGQPPLIVADEPTSSLDAGNQSAFLNLLFQQVAMNKATLMMVSHDPRLSGFFDRVIDMDDVTEMTRDTV